MYRCIVTSSSHFSPNSESVLKSFGFFSVSEVRVVEVEVPEECVLCSVVDFVGASSFVLKPSIVKIYSCSSPTSLPEIRYREPRSVLKSIDRTPLFIGMSAP